MQIPIQTLGTAMSNAGGLGGLMQGGQIQIIQPQMTQVSVLAMKMGGGGIILETGCFDRLMLHLHSLIYFLGVLWNGSWIREF